MKCIRTRKENYQIAKKKAVIIVAKQLLPEKGHDIRKKKKFSQGKTTKANTLLTVLQNFPEHLWTVSYSI